MGLPVKSHNNDINVIASLCPQRVLRTPSLALAAPLSGHPDTATDTAVAHPVTTAQATERRLADHHNNRPRRNVNNQFPKPDSYP